MGNIVGEKRSLTISQGVLLRMREAWDALGDYLVNLDDTLMQVAGPGALVVANDDTAEPPQIEAA